MNEEQKRWSEQYTANIGAREFLRLGCAIIIWVFILVALFVAFELEGYSTDPIFGTILVLTIFAFPFIAHSWKPMYSLLRKILGNNNLPTEPMPRSTKNMPREPRPWWSYLPGIWGWLMLLLLLYAILKR